MSWVAEHKAILPDRIEKLELKLLFMALFWTSIMRPVHHHRQPLVCYYKATLRREKKREKNIHETYQNRLSTIHMHTYYPGWSVSNRLSFYCFFECVSLFAFSIFPFFGYLSPITLFTAILYHTVETILDAECSTVSISSLALPFISIGLCFL